MEKLYVLVINNEIVSKPATLPNNYKNISNISSLSDEELSDLSWSGNNEGFWLVNSDPLPIVSNNQKIEISYLLDIQNRICHQKYTIINITTIPEEIKNNKIRANLKIIRDQYLLITDFTQLPDAPLSDDAKLDFKIFRQQLRDMLNVTDVTKIIWPIIPTSTSNIKIPPFPPISNFIN